MIACLVGHLLFADAANYAGTLELSNRSEVRARETQGDPQSPAFDFVDSALARLSLDDRRWYHFVQYSPVFTAPDLFQSGPQTTPLLLHAGSIGTRWVDRRVRLSLIEDVNYGTQNTTLLTTVAPGVASTTAPAQSASSAQIAGAPETLHFGMSRTSLIADMDPARRWRLNTSVAYVLQGGLDDVSRQSLPVQQGPRFDVTVGWRASRLDSLETHVGAQSSMSTASACPLVDNIPAGATCNPSAQLALAIESWRHRFSAETEGAAGVGVSAWRSRLQPDQPYDTSVAPSFEGFIANTSGNTTTFKRTIRLDVQVEPFVDVRSATSDFRAIVVGSLTIPYGYTTFRASLWGAKSIETQLVTPITLVRADVAIEHRLSPLVTVGVGASDSWQYQSPAGALESGLVYGQITVRAPVMRF